MFQEKYEVYKSLVRHKEILEEELESFFLKRMREYFLIVDGENYKDFKRTCENISIESLCYYREACGDRWHETYLPMDYIFLEEDEWKNYLNECVVEKNKNKELEEIKNKERMLNEYNNLKNKLGL
jgi:hypothetical protein